MSPWLRGDTGSPNLLVFADGNYQVDEGLNEENNYLARRVHVRSPDLRPVALTAPAVAGPDETITVNWTVRNEGALSASPPWTDRIYLSQDSLPGGDQFLAAVVRAAALPAGESYEASQHVTLPFPHEGDQYVLVVTDAGGEVPEGQGEGNNVKARLITALFPDLVPTALAAPDSVYTGQPVPMSWTVKNEGLYHANAPWTDRLFFSVDSLPGNDVLLREVIHAADLDAGQSCAVPDTAILPMEQAGDCYLIAQTDVGSTVDEGTREGNNIRVQKVFAPNFVPDLRVTQTQADPQVQYGQAAAVSWTVQNVSESFTARGPWVDRVYLSPDSIFGNGNEVFIGEQSSPDSLLPGAEYQAGGTFTVTGVDLADYWIIVWIGARSA